MVRITVLAGAGEIGGNKILLEDDRARVLLDFGISYSRRGQFFEEYLKPRTAAGLTDLLATGVLPAVPGLYRRDLLRLGGPHLPPAHETPAADAILLSHAHLDHAGHASFLDERIPVYCTAACHGILRAIQTIRGRDLECEIIDFLPRPYFRESGVAIPRPFTLVDGPFQVGSLSCAALPVDHSMLGCVAFLLRTSRGNVLYTGDLRFHGPEQRLSEAMLEAAAGEGIWLLLTEGTRLDVTDRRTEQEVFDECLQALRETRGPVIADFAPRDVYRLVTFLRIAQATDRCLVILPEDAYLLEMLGALDPLVPDPQRDPILILKERKVTGTYSPKDYRAKWERRVLTWPTVRTVADLHSMREKLILALSFWDIQNLVDLDVGPDALYIHSTSEAHSEEQALDAQRLRNWLDLLGVRRQVQSHASGHAPQPDLIRMVNTLRPEVLVPVHTAAPGLWRELVPEVRIVEPTAGVPMEW